MFVRRMPSLFLIGRFLCICFLDKTLVMAHNSLRFPLLAASSAW
jgi:hypothetical protein